RADSDADRLRISHHRADEIGHGLAGDEELWRKEVQPVSLEQDVAVGDVRLRARRAWLDVVAGLVEALLAALLLRLSDSARVQAAGHRRAGAASAGRSRVAARRRRRPFQVLVVLGGIEIVLRV